jgi:Flp pilus assembly protein TadD
MTTARPTLSLRHALLCAAPLLLGACTMTGGITPQEADVRAQVAVDQYMPASREMRDNIETQELFAQAAFWSHEYDLNPLDLEATLKLASAVRKLGNPSQAVEITQTARQIHPRDPYLLAEHSAGLIADERALDAIPVLDQGLRIAPAYARLWSLKGAALDQMEEYEAARQNYARALQITPNDPNVLTNLGLSHALTGDLRTSEMLLRRALDIPGSGISARQNLAMVLQLQGRTEEAEQQQRLAGLSRGDRKLPPPAVPALTPRGAPAQLAGPQSARQAPQPQLQAQPQQRAPQRLAPQQSQAPQGWGSYAAPAPNAPSYAPQAYPSQTYSPQAGQAPAARLSTTDANGQAFTSSRQAARQSVGQARIQTRNQATGQYAPPQGQPGAAPASRFGGPVTSEQQSVLNQIQRSLQPGAVGPTRQTTQTTQAAQPPVNPQAHVVGPALRAPSGPAPAPGSYAPQNYPPQGYAPQAQGQPQAYPQAYPQAQQPRATSRARDRRRR